MQKGKGMGCVGLAVSGEVGTRWFYEGAPPDDGVDVSR